MLQRPVWVAGWLWGFPRFWEKRTLHPVWFQLSRPLTLIGSCVQSMLEATVHLMSMRDPVCGAVLDENTAKFKITYEGETLHFCSLVCKKRFKRQPTKFIK